MTEPRQCDARLAAQDGTGARIEIYCIKDAGHRTDCGGNCSGHSR